MAIDLESRAADLVRDAITDGEAYDASNLHDSIMDDNAVHEDAAACCTYYTDIDAIIDEYENNAFVPRESELGQSFRPDQWRDAKNAWGFEIAYAVLAGTVSDILERIGEAADAMVDAASEHNVSIDTQGLMLYRDCPYGWAVLDREDSDGVQHWTNQQVDGMNALAVETDGVWLAYTWTLNEDSKPEE